MATSDVGLEIEAEDVLRVIMQFLQEQRLPASLRALEEESSVALNTVESPDSLARQITEGKWHKVLPQLRHVRLPQSVLWLVYEQAVLELLESGDAAVARRLLRSSALQETKRAEPEKLLRLEHACGRILAAQASVFYASEYYSPGETTATRRAAVAAAVEPHVTTVAPSRLLTLLQQAMRYQAEAGLLKGSGDGRRWDLFADGPKALAGASSEEKPVKKQCGVLKFQDRSHPESAVFAPDGSALSTGSVDGFLEIWDPETCTLRKDLEYQERGDLMAHSEAILCLAYSKEGDRIASGAQDGKIKVWDIETGRAIKRFGRAHGAGVTSLIFSKDSGQILSASFDQTAKLHGLRSGKTLKEFSGHESFVNAAVFSHDQTRVVTASSDGTVKMFDSRSRECLATTRLRAGTSADRSADGERGPVQPLEAVHVLVAVTSSTIGEVYATADRSTHAYLLGPRIEVLFHFPANPTPTLSVSIGSQGKTKPDAGISCLAISPKANFIYICTEDGYLNCLDFRSRELKKRILVSEREVIGLVHHPNRNLLATFSDDGNLKLWKP